MNKTLPFLALALAQQQQDFTLTDEQLTLSAQQVDTIEAFIQTLQAKLDEQLKANDEQAQRIAALEKQLSQKPADETAQVINTSTEHQPTEAEAFYITLAAARALYNQLP